MRMDGQTWTRDETNSRCGKSTNAPTNSAFCSVCLCVLWTHRDYISIQHKLNGFCDEDRQCLLRGTDWNSIRVFISVFNQLDAENLFHNKFYFIPLHVSSICAHHQEVKIALHSLWYQVWWYQRLCNAILTSWWWAHVIETCRGMK